MDAPGMPQTHAERRNLPVCAKEAIVTRELNRWSQVTCKHVNTATRRA